MSEVNSWSTTAASNNSASPDGFPEGMAPSGVNDGMREVMAAIAKYRSDTDGVNTTGGTANAQTLAASRVMTAYTAGDLYTFKAGATNTGAMTLNVDGVGAKAIQSHTEALIGGEIVSGGVYTVVYDGTQFQLLNPYLPYRVLFRQATTVQVISSTAETDLFTFTVPANTLGSSKTIYIDTWGNYFNNTGSNQDITLRAVYGATNIFTTGAVPWSSGALSRGMYLRIRLSGNNGTSSQSSAATLYTTPIASAGAAGVMSATTVDFVTSATNTLAEDSTANKTLALKVTLGASSANLHYQIRYAIATLT